jgi:hypothetical protein
MFFIVPAVGELLVKFNTCADVISVKLTLSMEAYTRNEPFLLPVELLIDAQSNFNTPAFNPEKFKERSTAADVLLSVVPVDNKPILSDTLCKPPEGSEEANEVVAVVILVPFGIVPVPPLVNPFHADDPWPVAKVPGVAELKVQFAMSAKVSE